MNIIIHPPHNEWSALLQRPAMDHSMLEAAVLEVLNNVKQNGDKALVEFTQRFDGVLLKNIKVSDVEIAAAEKELTTVLKADIAQSKEHI